MTIFEEKVNHSIKGMDFITAGVNTYMPSYILQYFNALIIITLHVFVSTKPIKRIHLEKLYRYV